MPPSVKPPSSSSEVAVEDQEGEAFVARHFFGLAAQPAAKRRAGQVVVRPGRLPRRQEGPALLAQPRPRAKVRGDRRAQIEPVAAQQRLRVGRSWRDGTAPCRARHPRLQALATAGRVERLADAADRGDGRRRSKHGRARLANVVDADRRRCAPACRRATAARHRRRSGARVAARARDGDSSAVRVETFNCALARSTSVFVEPHGGLGEAVERGAPSTSPASLAAEPA